MFVRVNQFKLNLCLTSAASTRLLCLLNIITLLFINTWKFILHNINLAENEQKFHLRTVTV